MKTITIQNAIALLNEINALDPRAISSLVHHRVPCSKELAAHPTVQVGDITGGSDVTVGLLGIINGLFGPDEFIGAIGPAFGLVREFGLYGEMKAKLKAEQEAEATLECVNPETLTDLQKKILGCNA